MFAWVSLRQNHKDWISCTGLKGIWEVKFIIKGKWVSCKDLFKEKTSTEIFTTTVNFFPLNIIIHTFSLAFILLHWINSSSFDLCQFSWKYYELESKNCFKTYFSDNNAKRTNPKTALKVLEKDGVSTHVNEGCHYLYNWCSWPLANWYFAMKNKNSIVLLLRNCNSHLSQTSLAAFLWAAVPFRLPLWVSFMRTLGSCPSSVPHSHQSAALVQLMESNLWWPWSSLSSKPA